MSIEYKKDPDLEDPEADYVRKIEDMEELTRNKVSDTLSAVDVAIASYDAAKKKPPGLKPRVDRLRKIKNALEKWEKESLQNASTKDVNSRIKRLWKFTEICDRFA